MHNSRMIRAQKQAILADLEKKLVLLIGPRQSGKTWLSKDIAKSFSNAVYLNYDKPIDKKIIHDQAWLDTTDLLILDELHKMQDWKNYLKGVYDTKPQSMRLLVTGSAQLDVYDKLGDSLAGRYFRHRLFPLSLAELRLASEPVDLEKLLQRGGFPEPYFASDMTEANRWRMHYINSLISTDIFEIEPIQNLKAMRLILELLRTRVGSPVSYQSLAEDVGVSPSTVKKYINILEALYIIFSVTPYSRNIARSLLKEPKIYFFDTALVQGDDGAKFENLVAVSLLKHVCGLVDYKALEYTLHYLRTKDGHEVDFAVALNGEIHTAIEAKISDRSISKTLMKFCKTYTYQGIQLVKSLGMEYQEQPVSVLKADKYLAQLFL